MAQSCIEHEDLRAAYAEQLRRGLTRLRFDQRELESEFSRSYLQYSLPRGRLAVAVGLLLVLAIAGMSLATDPTDVIRRVDIMALAVLAPWIVLVLAVMCLPGALHWYTGTAFVGITIAGVIVTFLSQVATLGGASYFMVAEEFLLINAFLFLGTLFEVSMLAAVLLIAAHFIVGAVLGVPVEPLLFVAAILVATAVIAATSQYKLERALRMGFLETSSLHEAAERDSLTELYNRRSFDDQVRRLWRQARRENVNLEIVFIDIDYFKIYNDLYGHQAGDECLRQVAAAIRRCAKRPLDFCSRYGGEEFVLVLYGPPEEYSCMVPDQIRRDVMARGIRHEGSIVADVVTISVGVAMVLPDTTRSLTGAIQIADKALYQAKGQGRNRVVIRTISEDLEPTGSFRNTFSKSA